jgi:hypothetical protein
MATLRSHITIDRPADEVWSVVSDAGRISEWFPAVATSTASDNGRSCSGSLQSSGTVERPPPPWPAEPPLRHTSQRRHIGLGHRHAGTTVLVLIHDLPVRALGIR